jgi:hypothetical protein
LLQNSSDNPKENHDQESKAAMKTITLTQGYVALVSDKDYTRVVNAGPWRALEDKRKDGSLRNVYAMRSVKRYSQTLHRFILGLSGKGQADHYPDPNGLNNQRSNLRKANNDENSRNQRLSKANTSGFKGVYWNKNAQKWQAQIVCSQKHYYLGLFDSAEVAARAYDAKALELFGKFANLNFKRRPQ